MALVGVIGWPQETNVELAAAWRARGIPAEFLNPSADVFRCRALWEVEARA
jgi:hypothetical protein